MGGSSWRHGYRGVLLKYPTPKLGCKMGAENWDTNWNVLGRHISLCEGWRNDSVFVDGIEFSRQGSIDDRGEGRNFWSSVSEWGK